MDRFLGIVVQFNPALPFLFFLEDVPACKSTTDIRGRGAKHAESPMVAQLTPHRVKSSQASFDILVDCGFATSYPRD